MFLLSMGRTDVLKFQCLFFGLYPVNILLTGQAESLSVADKGRRKDTEILMRRFWVRINKLYSKIPHSDSIKVTKIMP